VVDQAGKDAAPKWNFHKYLTGKKGELLETFGSRISPAAPEIKKSIEQALA
jgi:glutathione peroxidase